MSAEATTTTRAKAQALPLAAWRLKDFDVGAGVAAKAFEANAGGSDWIDISAPGDTYLALHAAGQIAHPFDDRAEEACSWVPDREWWWRTDFDAPELAPDQRLVLEIEGLDTFADIWLNGEKIARSDNMFLPLRLDVTRRVKQGVNRLAVAFTPTSAALADAAPPLWPRAGATLVKSKRAAVRKAQFGWGWDWGPTLPTVGIWKPVTLRLETVARLTHVQFETLELASDKARAKVRVTVDADAFAPGALSVEVRLADPHGHDVADAAIPLPGGPASVTFDIRRPQLWWTPELGKPELYRLTVSLSADGVVIDERREKVGIRTIALDQSPDPEEPGATFFRFVLNGVPIFAKGACWIPASSFVAVVDRAHYAKLIARAVEANMNMLRIWGGGVYEHDAFYDLCDENGVLVWQDFMFACAPYPEAPESFVRSVTDEVRAQVQHLRNHPSIALWCGNNENLVIHVGATRGSGEALPGDLYFEKIMPELCAELDPTRPYWPGSPYGGAHPNSMIAGDVHDWTVWHGAPPVPVDKPVGKWSIEPENVAYTRYAEDMARFVSEYGLHASPVMETLRRALPEAERRYNSEGLLARIKDNPKNKVDSLLVSVTGIPANLEDYVDFTQIAQAEGMKFAVEHFRRRKPHCSGSLIWQHNDCWPCVSWSLVDYYGFGKASHYYVRRAYAPVMASFKPGEGGAMELWVVNDTLAPVKGEATVALQRFSGEVLWSRTIAADVGPNESRCVWRGEAAGGASEVLTVRSATDAFPANRVFFVPIKDLDRATPAAPDVRIEAAGSDEVRVTISARDYLFFVHLLNADEATCYSDNYFDLAAGETRVITVRNPVRPLTPADVSVRWR
ncbi:MAG TPA: glycoside hydrolase family 2 protein [Caulobacteraceae bacterium]|nr:glycoside hydrolase family 2 protein [Caulobacteraceae bacterium]